MIVFVIIRNWQIFLNRTFLRYPLIVSFSKFHKSAAICLAQAFYYIGIAAFNLIKLYPLTNSDTLDNFVNRFQPPTRSGQLAIAQEFWLRIFFALGQLLKYSNAITLLSRCCRRRCLNAISNFFYCLRRRRQKKPLRNRTVGQYKRLMHGVKREVGESNGGGGRGMGSEYRDESILANRAPFSSFTYTMAAGNGIANPTTLHASWQLVILRPVLRQHPVTFLVPFSLWSSCRTAL